MCFFLLMLFREGPGVGFEDLGVECASHKKGLGFRVAHSSPRMCIYIYMHILYVCFMKARVSHNNLVWLLYSNNLVWLLYRISPNPVQTLAGGATFGISGFGLALPD